MCTSAAVRAGAEIVASVASTPLVSASSAVCTSAAVVQSLRPFQGITGEEIRSLLISWPSSGSQAWRLVRPTETVSSDFEREIRTVRLTASAMASLLLNMPDIDDNTGAIPANVISWLCRYFR